MFGTLSKNPLNLILFYEELRVKTFPLIIMPGYNFLLSIFMQHFFWHKHIFTFDKTK